MAGLRKVTAAAVAVVIAAAMVGGCAFFEGATSASTSPSTGHVSTSVAASTSVTPVTTVAPVTTTSVPLITTSTTEAPSTTTSATAPPSPTTTLTPGKNYQALPTQEKVVALTFDAAYDPAPLKGILAALEGAEADATFFLTGEFVRDFPSYTKLILAAGHPIGNHSYTHPDFTGLSDEKMRSEIERTAAALVELGAPDPQPLFRAPYGALDKRVLSVLAGEGYVSVYWTIDTLDWKPERTPEQIRNVVLKNLKPGAIVLMHVGSKQELDVLPGLLEEIKSRGYRFVNLRDALPRAGD